MEHELKRCLAPKYKLAIIEFTERGTLYKCVECPSAYGEKEALEIHLTSHFKEFRFLCGICGTGLKRKEHLERHTLGHQEVRPHVCSECGKGFKRKEHLNIHRSIHSGAKSHTCALCNRTFYRKDHMQKHLQTHSKMFAEGNLSVVEPEFVDIKQEGEYDRQSVEDVEFEASMEVDENSLLTEFVPPKDPNRPFECCICHKTYKRKDHLKLHSVTHLKKDKICSECGKAFHREEQLLIHMHTHLRPYQPQPLKEEPPIDPQAMFDPNQIEVDVVPAEEPNLLVPLIEYGSSPEASAPVEQRPHQCHVCHRRFKRKQHLKVHSNVHQKVMPTIWCSLCNEGFLNNDQFESHLCPGYVTEESDEHTVRSRDAKKENHPDFGVKILPRQIELDLPILPASEIEEKDLPTPQRVYVCKFCSKTFRRKDHYKIHLHIHTGVKSFYCPECNKGFYRKDHLQKHMQVHSKGKSLPPTPIPISNPPTPIPILNAPPPMPTSNGPRGPKKQLPGLFPINKMQKKEIRPEITITAPSNSSLRVPLQIKVPYQVVMSLDNGEQRSVTVDPSAHETLVV